MTIREILERVNFGCLSIFRRDDQFCIVNHESETFEYFDCLAFIVSKGERSFTSFDLIDKGLNVIGVYRNNLGERAWLVGRNRHESAIKPAQPDIEIETIDAALV